MKKLIVIMMGVLLLVGCNSKGNASEQVLICETEDATMGKYTIEVVVVNEKVKGINVEMRMPYEAMGITKDQFDKTKDLIAQQFESVFEEIGTIEMKGEKDGVVLKIKVNESGLSSGAFGFDIEEMGEKVNINELKASAEKSGSTCKIK